MNIVSINLHYAGSTGKIVASLAKQLASDGDIMWACYPKFLKHAKKTHDIIIGGYIARRLNRRMAMLTSFNDCFSQIATLKLISKIKRIKPDIIHLHNLHNNYLNIKILFSYIKKNNVPVVWTLHDCWAFTGHCPHFTLIKCDKWKTGCHHCPQYRCYPKSYVDRSKYMYQFKRKLFSGIENMTIVTPSQWLAELVKQSYLNHYPVKIINNSIDLEIFKPTHSEFRKKYHLDDRFIILGVAFDWDKRKGLDAFVELSKRLDYRFRIVLVGTNEAIDRQLPDSIISIHKTENQTELAEIYTAADLFVNPTREENYPTVNMEAIACGTPVLTFRTGGSPEIIDAQTGVVVECDDVDAMEKEIIHIAIKKPFAKSACLEKAKSFDSQRFCKKYSNLYHAVLGGDKP